MTHFLRRFLYDHPRRVAKTAKQIPEPRCAIPHIGIFQLRVSIGILHGQRPQPFIGHLPESALLHNLPGDIFQHIMQESADLGRAEPRLPAGAQFKTVLQKMAHAAGAHPIHTGGGQANLSAIELFYQFGIAQRAPRCLGILPQLAEIFRLPGITAKTVYAPEEALNWERKRK